MTAKVYNPAEVTIYIGGALIDSGFADGAFLSIEMVSDEVTSVAGSDGEVAVSVNRDRRANVTLTLLQTSDGNRVLQEKLNAARAFEGSPSLGDFMVRDRNGLSIYESESIYVTKRPDATFDRSPTSREWNLQVPDLDSYEGGNNEL